ncbi:MAG: chorismate-binding protein [Burkholderiales bacterium]|nr:chorismate-binding protein [Burkholderiales bacterium]
MDVTVELDFPEEDGARLRLHAVQPDAQWQADAVAEVRAAIDRAQAEAQAGRWVVGFVAFEAAPAFDPALRTRPAHATLPLAAFYAFDAAQVAASAHVTRGVFECGPWRADDDAARAHAMVRAIQTQIAAGTFYQVNVATRLRAAFSGDAGALHAQLVQAQPQAYCARIATPAWEIHSVSPELFFDWRDALLTTRPMKGTAPRFPDTDRDEAAKAWLAASDKDRAENVMIVDLLRNDLSRIARIGSVHTPRLFTLEALPTAWQMTSTVQCRTRAGIGLADVFAALFPCGSVTGAPKISAMQAITTLESSARGVYCGAVGVIRPGGHATFNVAIRTVCMDRVRSQAECGVGSGITIHSTAAGEHDEWMIKRRFLLRASAGFDLLETMRLEEGTIWLWPEHLERLRRAANHFGFALDEAALAALETRLRAAHPRGAWRVRLLCARDGSLRTEVAALDESPAQVTVQLAVAPVDSGEEFLRYKTTERRVYAAHQPPQGVFDTLLWNERGELTEFTRGNVVLELDGRHITPAAHCGLLPGAHRAALLRRGDIVEDVVRREDLARCERVWFINSVRGWLPARLQPPPVRC